MKKKPIPSISVPNDTRALPLHQEIATQAYVLWNHYGQPAGRDVSIWLEAEQQVLGVDAQVNQQAGAPSTQKILARPWRSIPGPPTCRRRSSATCTRRTGEFPREY